MLARAMLLCTVVGCGRVGPPSAVLVTVDTLRADHLGAYGAEKTRTPRLDAFAREATVFERAIAPMPLTRPAHFSMLTARHPREHGVLTNAMKLPQATRTLPEILHERGWRTAAFTAVKLLGPDSGAAQGFELFEASGSRRERRGGEVVASALAWLDGLGADERFFLWVHLFEPHLPYAPARSFREELGAEGAAVPPSLAWEDLEDIAREHGGDVPAPVLEHARRLYRGEVAAADHFVGRLLDGLAARRPMDGVLVVLTADHGECFENGVWFEHSDCLYEGALHVPLIVRFPREFPAGVRVPHPVSLVDVAPTVLRAAGLDPLPDAAGRPLQASAEFVDRHVLVQHPFYQERALSFRRKRQRVIRSVAGRPIREIVAGSEWLGLVGPRWKLLVRDGIEELYPLAPRADESESLATSEPAVLADLRQRLAAELAAHPLTRIDGSEVNEELRRTLEALGYLAE